ncbi:MAG TPA: TaqI-like C-terminal specificity domain-containing protein [Ignavibacteria bacterium]
MENFDSAFAIVTGLVKDFKENEKRYLSPEYQEAEVRRDFIDKFFEALGWDVYHSKQKNPYEQEVKVEKGVSIGKAQKRADYSFCISPNYRDTKFYVEAKKPSKNLYNPDYYFQAIRYGWNANTPIVILTDFEEFHIIDSRFKPDIRTALDRQIERYHYSEYLDKEKLSRIYYLLSREAVENNSIDKRAAELPKPRGKALQKGLIKGGYQSIDESFLEELDEIRLMLAKIFKKNNPGLTSEELTEATQRTIDRLVFMRFLEDKLIEGEHFVNEFGKRNSVWKDFITTSKRLDVKYNGVVFKNHPIIDSPTFKETDDSNFRLICERLSYENTPYDFNIIPIHILGSIYERFLGKIIHATDKQVRIEEKLEVRKAGGVYYTVLYIVRYIVVNTIGKIIEGKTPKEISKLRFIDISCGSGSFLIIIFDTLLHYIGKWYQEHPEQAKKDGCIFKEGQWVLSLKQKREILLNNIYGVDIDSQAVEVTQLSLFLKLLEDETTATANEMQVLFKEKILPDLSKNIVCGNSLIGTDIYDGNMFPTVEERKINAMNFEDVFPEIMKNGGFDAIVGNPPYVRKDTIDNINKIYFEKIYFSSFKQYDIYVLFLEKALKLLKDEGLVSYIVSNKFLISDYGKNIRKYILDNSEIKIVVDVSYDNVFKDASIYPLILVLKRQTKSELRDNNYIFYSDNMKDINGIKFVTQRQSSFLKDDYSFSLTSIGKKWVDKVDNNKILLGDICQITRGFRPPPEYLINKNNSTEKYLIGKDLKTSYRFCWSGNKVKYLENKIAESKSISIFKQPKILFRDISLKFNACYDEDGFLCLKTIYFCYLKLNKGISLKFLSGVLNCKLINKYFETKFSIAHIGGGYLRFRKQFVEKIPIKEINFQNEIEKQSHDKIVQFVDQMLEAKKQLQTITTDKDKTYYERRCESIDRQIDQLVYELYGLTEEEIKIVEGKNNGS